MLPQKKNADIAEAARGKAGRLIGNLTGFLATLKSLPLAYNKDLREDKEPLFDAVDQIGLALVAMAGMIDTATIVPEDGRCGRRRGHRRTDLAEFLVRTGMPFREAHGGRGTGASIWRAASRRALAAADSRLRPDVALVAGRERHPTQLTGWRWSGCALRRSRPVPCPARR